MKSGNKNIILPQLAASSSNTVTVTTFSVLCCVFIPFLGSNAGPSGAALSKLPDVRMLPLSLCDPIVYNYLLPTEVRDCSRRCHSSLPCQQLDQVSFFLHMTTTGSGSH